MTSLPDLIRDELTALADSSPVPADLGARAIAGGRRRRRRFGAAFAAATAAGIGLTLLIASVSGGLAPAAPAKANAVFAYYAFPGGQERVGWHVLDPVTGDYRPLDVATVTAPTADLRYAAVSAAWPAEIEAEADLSHQRRLGRYDTSTGAIRWYDVPVPLDTAPHISPDGRYAAVVVPRSAGDLFGRLLLVDLASGQATGFDVPLAGAASAVQTGVGSPFGFFDDGLTWRPDSRHLALGTAIVDLSGHRAGSLPLPPDTILVSASPDGAGALVEPESLMLDANHTYELTDGSGAVTARVTAAGCADSTPRAVTPVPGQSVPPGPSSPDPSAVGPAAFDASATPSSIARPSNVVSVCSSDHNAFLGWRGPATILVMSGNKPRFTIDSLDLRTGVRRVLRDMPLPYTTVQGLTAMVVVPMDGLSDQARDRAGF
jgi:hypothetical protein